MSNSANTVFSEFNRFCQIDSDRAWIDRKIIKWFSIQNEPVTGASLQQLLANSDNQYLHELIRDPLHLWMLCQLWQLGSILPETKTQLYSRFVDRAYDWTYRYQLDDDIYQKRPQIDAALARLALKAMLATKAISRVRLHQSWIKTILNRRDLERLEELGWLDRLEGNLEPVYRFYHIEFQRYFAALAIDRWQFFLNPSQGVYRIFQSRWKPIILFWLGREDIYPTEKEAFIDALIHFEDGCDRWTRDRDNRGFYEYRAYFLAASGMAEFQDCQKLPEIVSQIVAWGLGWNPKQWKGCRPYLDPIATAARAILPETNRKVAIAKLRQIARTIVDKQYYPNSEETVSQTDAIDADPTTAIGTITLTVTDELSGIEVAESLDNIDPGSSDSIAVLLTLMQAGMLRETHRLAAKHLETIGVAHPDAIAGLIQLTRLDKLNRREISGNLVKSGAPIREMRRQAVRSLGQVGCESPEAVAALADIIEISDDPEIQRLAAQSLGKVGTNNTHAIATLLKVINHSEQGNIRSEAIKSLGQIGHNNPEAIAVLVEAVQSEQNREARYHAVKGLKAIGCGNSNAIAPLVAIARSTTDTDTCKQVIEVLGKIGVGDPEVIAVLLELSQTTIDESIAYKAIKSLGRVSDRNPDVITMLTELARTTTNEELQFLAAENLYKIDPSNSEAMATLTELATIAIDEGIRLFAAENLIKISPSHSEAIATLTDLTHTANESWIRRIAPWKLASIGINNPKIIKLLLNLTDEVTDELVRWEIFRNLANIGANHSMAIARWIELARTSPEGSFRWQAVTSLGEIHPGHPDAIAALIDTIQTTTDKLTRQRAIDSLGNIGFGNSNAIAALVELIHATEDDEDRWLAVKSLGNISDAHPDAIAVWLSFICIVTETKIRWKAVRELETILNNKAAMQRVVAELRDELSEATYKLKPDRFKACYHLVWTCAQSLSYPDFYRVWNGDLEAIVKRPGLIESR